MSTDTDEERGESADDTDADLENDVDPQMKSILESLTQGYSGLTRTVVDLQKTVERQQKMIEELTRMVENDGSVSEEAIHDAYKKGLEQGAEKGGERGAEIGYREGYRRGKDSNSSEAPNALPYCQD